MGQLSANIRHVRPLKSRVRIMKKSRVHTFGKSGVFEQKIGLTDDVARKITLIITYTGSIEYYTERALWKSLNQKPEVGSLETDAKPITTIIKILQKSVKEFPDKNVRTLLLTWCKAAYSAFIIRNNISHGVALNIGEALVFMRNPQWSGEIRKRDFGNFWADPIALELVCDSMATLLRVITSYSESDANMEQIATNEALLAIHEAKSILGEFSARDYPE
jgi:hypothetical protein